MWPMISFSQWFQSFSSNLQCQIQNSGPPPPNSIKSRPLPCSLGEAFLQWSATRMAEAIKSGEVTSLQLVEASIQRIQEVDVSWPFCLRGFGACGMSENFREHGWMMVNGSCTVYMNDGDHVYMLMWFLYVYMWVQCDLRILISM